MEESVHFGSKLDDLNQEVFLAEGATASECLEPAPIELKHIQHILQRKAKKQYINFKHLVFTSGSGSM